MRVKSSAMIPRNLTAQTCTHRRSRSIVPTLTRTHSLQNTNNRLEGNALQIIKAMLELALV
jgi:hypothetical protein